MAGIRHRILLKMTALFFGLRTAVYTAVVDAFYGSGGVDIPEKEGKAESGGVRIKIFKYCVHGLFLSLLPGVTVKAQHKGVAEDIAAYYFAHQTDRFDTAVSHF